MQEGSYGEFSLALHRRAVQQRIPLEGAIEATQRCNLSCVHCYNNLPSSDLAARRSELTYEEHCRILDEITEAGCLWLLYTGGEIFLRPDFLNIYTYAKQKGLLITLFTNGTLLTPKSADYLSEWRPFSVEITLYGRTKETYERVTGVPGSFEKCMRGIRLLMERKLPLKLKAVVMNLNVHEIWDLKRFVEEDLGLEFRFDAMINPRIDGSRRPTQVRLRPEEIVQLDVQDPKRMAEWKRFVEKFCGSPRSPQRPHRLYECGGGVGSFTVDPTGGLSICVLSREDVYDLRNGRFSDGWDGFIYSLRQREIARIRGTPYLSRGLPTLGAGLLLPQPPPKRSL